MTGIEKLQPLDFGKVAVLMGGDSAEREISLRSGKAVLDSLLRSGVDAFGIDTGRDVIAALQNHSDIDRVLIMLHGGDGEDGRVQALLELMELPYTGSGVLASALAMDKARSKQLWLAGGLRTPEFQLLSETTDWEALIADLGACFVKPINEGSSIGISLAKTAEELQAAYLEAKRFDREVMAEKLISGAEYSVSILAGRSLPVIELRTGNVFYDFQAKYEAADTQYLCPCDLDTEKTAEIQHLAMAAYQQVGCHGWARADMMCDAEGHFWLLEINTVPGMTSHSLVPMSAKAAGISFDELVLQILASSTNRQGRQS